MKPEKKLQRALVEYLTVRGWHCKNTHGNAYQSGFPDVYAMHTLHGWRWIDTKIEGRYSFTKAQRSEWPLWERYGTGVWILTGADQENYNRLFAPANWRAYWKAAYGYLPGGAYPPDKERLVDELEDLLL